MASRRARTREVWVDINHATREQIARCFGEERDGIAAQLTQIKIDVDYFNSIHPNDEPVVFVFDFSEDVVEGKLARTGEAWGMTTRRGERRQ